MKETRASLSPAMGLGGPGPRLVFTIRLGCSTVLAKGLWGQATLQTQSGSRTAVPNTRMYNAGLSMYKTSPGPSKEQNDCLGVSTSETQVSSCVILGQLLVSLNLSNGAITFASKSRENGIKM